MHLIDQQLNFMLRGQFEEAWKISEELEKMGPNGIEDPTGKKNPEMWLRHCFNRGWFYVNQGKFVEGMQLLENGRFLNVYGGGKLPTTKPIWHHDDPLEGKTVILSMEGGFGDEIIHVRFAKQLADRGATVVVAASPELHTVFARVPGVSKVIVRSKEDVDSTPHDYWIPAFSAGWLLNSSFEELPREQYIFPIPESVDMWKNIIKADDGVLKVGIRWSGNPKFEHQQFRNFPSEMLTDLHKMFGGIKVFSLQRDNDTKELDPAITDLQYLLLSWEDTAAAIANLDIVITSCTSVAHIAAAMGKQTWVIVPALSYHTWAHNAPVSRTSPWYDSVRLFRQTELGKWKDTFAQLYDEFESTFNLERLSMNNVDIADVDVSAVSNRAPGTYKLSFIAGLPNSGADMIAKALELNSDVKASQHSGLFELVASTHYNWETFSRDVSNKPDVLKAMLYSFFAKDAPTHVVDSNPMWINMIPLLEAVMGEKVRIVVPVRNPAEILSSYEVQRTTNALRADRQELNNNMSTIAARCYHYSRPEGDMGLPHSQTLDAVTGGYRDRLLFVDYNKLCNEPRQQISRIADFLGIEAPTADLSKIIVKEHLTPVDVIGFDLFNMYNSQIFWQNWV